MGNKSSPDDLGLPRLRGDGPRLSLSVVEDIKAPPPTRGWTFPSSAQSKTPSGSPAYAGMDPKGT